MYFQLDNTPENVRKKRDIENSVQQPELPRLELAPFTSHPIVTFENIPINSVTCKSLQIYNPHSYDKQVNIVKPPPVDLGIELSWKETIVLANDIAILEIRWSPKTVTSQRFTMQLADQKKGRFDVIIVCKTIVDTKNAKTNGKKKISVTSKPVGVKKSPKVKTRRSPKTKFYVPCGDKFKNILEVTSCVTRKYQKSPVKQQTFINICPQLQTHTPTSKPDTRRETYLVNDPDYDKENDSSFQRKTNINNMMNDLKSFTPTNILSAIDNLDFTPLKVTKYHKKEEVFVEKHEQFQYILTENSPRLNKYNTERHFRDKKVIKSNFDAMIDNIDNSLRITPKYKGSENGLKTTINNQNKANCNQTYGENIEDDIINDNINKNTAFTANLTHSIIDLCETLPSKCDEIAQIHNITISKPTTIVDEPDCQVRNQYVEENSINVDISSFTPNTKNNLSEINLSMDTFNPNRCSTERKDCENKLKNTSCNEKISRELLLSYSPNEALNSTYGKLSSGTYTKGDSPIIPLKPSNQSSPYSICGSPPPEPVYKQPTIPRKLPFSESSRNYMERADLKNAIKERNTLTSVKDIIEANLWQKTPPRPISPMSLATIPEESTLFEMSLPDGNKKCDTFVINKTFEIPKPMKPPSADNSNAKWNKTGIVNEIKKTKVLHKSFGKEIMPNTSDVNKDMEFSYTNVKSISTTMDPFLATTCLYDERAYDELQVEFKKWLNYLLTPPAELDTNLDDSKMDVVKAWIESHNKNVPAAPTKEQVSAKYHTSHRLESLRKSAKIFSEKQHIREVFIKVSNQVEKKLLAIREDRKIHVNIGLQKMILNLLLCYNPLWLRIGLETLYNRNIPLTSNNDIMGLSSFIVEYMFKDPNTNTKHSTNMYSQQYVESIKKFTLKKFLFLVYFLDQAKSNKIIPHDPCLFCRNALFKESKELLFQFTKEVIAGVGDITRHLKPTGYIVSHKQTYLHEFKYAVHNLAIDLKDGVRLTRLMEIILMKDNLTSGLRTPAISRLQKIHNVKIALTALESAGFSIVGDITPKDIVDGHREKTLSLLWQLINKFRAPLFCQSALVIQKWWRKKYLRLWLEKRIEYKKNFQYHTSAVIIQSWWRSILSRRQSAIEIQKRISASIVIQKHWRMLQQRKQFLMYVKSSTVIQMWYRGIMEMKKAKTFLKHLKRSAAASKIQIWYRLKTHRKILELQNTDRPKFLQIKKSAITIQNAVRAYLQMNQARSAYTTLKISTIKIQRYYRSIVVTRYIRKEYLLLKSTTLFVQKHFRANILRKECQKNYHIVRNSIVKIQQYYRNWLITKEIRKKFLKVKSACIVLQQRYRAICCMKMEQKNYLKKKKCAINIQRYFRGYLQMKIDRKKYLERKALILLQKREQAALIIQRKYRAYLEMETERGKYLILRSSVIKIQNMFRSYLVTKSIREEYVILRNTTNFIQQKYRAKLAMLQCMKEYQEKKYYATEIQRYYRSYRAMKMECEKYLTMKQAAITLQSRYRCLTARRKYIEKKNAIVKIQSFYRMYVARKRYIKIKHSAIVIQRYYRTVCIMREVKMAYDMNKLSVIKIQSLFRMHIERRKYLQIRHAVLLVQKLYRKKLYDNRQRLLRQTFASIIIQTAWRRYVQYERYKKLKTSTTVCQNVWRSILEMRKKRQEYLKLKINIIKLQAVVRGYLVRKCIQIQCKAAVQIQSVWRMHRAKKDYKKLKSSAIIFQNRWRAMLQMRKCRMEYLNTVHNITLIQAACRGYLLRNCIRQQHSAATCIQSGWRRYVAHSKYISLKNSVLLLQNKWRAVLSMRSEQCKYLEIKHAVVVIQSYYRGYCVRRKVSRLQSSVLVCQRRWRALLEMRKQKQEYNSIRQSIIQLQAVIRGCLTRNIIARKNCAAIKIQSIFKQYLAYKKYQQILSSTIFIQHKWRALLATRCAQRSYLIQRNTIINLQAIIRGYLFRKTLNIKKTSVLKIQTAWRCYMVHRYYKQIKHSAIVCQQKRRAIIEMRRQKKIYELLRHGVIKLQARIRGNIARSQFVIMQRQQKELKRKRLETNSAIIIQKYWRGYEVRKMQAEHCRVATLRKRWQQGALQSDQLTLAERSEDAMDVLCHFKDVASVIRAFKTLDYVTKVYPMMYSSEDTAVPIINRLVMYMGATNRSVSTLETLQLGAAILLNLTKYSPTAHFVYKVEHVDTILTLMLHWCDKDNLLLRSFCTLLWMFGKYDDIKKDLSQFLKSSKSYKILCRVRSGLVRRRRMDSRKRNSIRMSLPNVVNLSKSFNDSMRLSMTPVKAGKPQCFSHLPATEPDYGIERNNQPKLFMDEIQAIDSVFLKFDLSLNFVSEN